MKTLTLFLSVLFISFTTVAQDKTDKIKVSGECGMCKSKIEKAAKSAGASYALWDVEKKELTVTYNHTSSNASKIEKAIAAVGYDTQNEKATTETYNKLHECCKYERTSANEAKSDCCADCKDGKCTSQNCADCCKDGKCTKNMDCCKDGKCEMHSDSSHAAKTAAKPCCSKS